MTRSGLAGLFDGLAAETRQYDVRDTVLRKATRRRRLVRLTLAAVAIAVVLGIGAVWVPLHGGGAETTTGPAAPSAPWLPREVDGSTATQPLPADRAVGSGALLYRSKKAQGYEYSLVTTDGRYYDVPQPVTTLSPGGRWLGHRGKNGYVLRDLTGTTVRSIPAGYMPLSIFVPDSNGGGTAYTNRFGVREWSSDNRWLLLAGDRAGNGPEGPFYRYDLSTGAVEQIETPTKLADVLAVLPTGEVLVEQLDAPRRLVTLVAIDPVTGAQRNRITIDLNEYVPAGGYLQRRTPGADGGSLLIEWTDKQGGPIKAMDIDLVTGQRRLVDIRPQQDQAKDWWVHTILPEGIVTVQRHAMDRYVLRLVDPATGKQRVVCTLHNLFGDVYAMQLRGT